MDEGEKDMKKILSTILLALVLLSVMVSKGFCQTIVNHRDVVSKYQCFTATVYVYQDLDSMATEDFYAFWMRVHGNDTVYDFLWVTIETVEGTCDKWEPTEGASLGGSVTLTIGYISIGVNLIPLSYTAVDGEYTNTISWFFDAQDVDDVEFAAGFWVLEGSPLHFKITVTAAYFVPSLSFPVWKDTATWSSTTRPQLSISTTSGGTTNPASGTYTYDYGLSVTVTASAYSGYTFNYWVLDGATVYNNPITVTMDSDHTLKAYFYYSGGGGGGGCPYVYVWDGQCYVMDNNLLPASEISDGDVEDYYKLEQSLVPAYQGTALSLYSLQIREFEHEHDYFNQVKLLAVDHSSNVNVAVSPYGEILTYGNPVPPVCAVDEASIDVLSQLSSVDGNYYQGYNGSHITLTFAPTDVSNGVKLVIREEDPTGPPLLKCPVYVQVLNATEDWNTIATFHTRTYWATAIINMTGYLPDPEGNLRVRLCFVSNDKIDYISLDTTPQASIEVHQAFLLSAFHSTQGNVKPLLMKNDQTYAELIPGERIQLAFRLQNNQNEERTFILYTEGHYHTIET
jgi:hypothetical protein